MRATKSKRFWFSVSAFTVNAIIYLLAILCTDHEPASVGTGLTLLNSPIYVYVFSETKRPSKKPENAD